jgi:hypothetical protein
MEVKGISTRATATFEIKTWDEKPLNKVEELPKLTRVSATRSFTGNIEGEGTTEYLMMYRDDGSASFVGLERLVGRVDNRRGSFVFQHNGVRNVSIGLRQLVSEFTEAAPPCRPLVGAD